MIVVEVTRPTPATTPQQLANIAKTAIACGADALCVRLDSEDTPEGMKDLFAVVQVSVDSTVAYFHGVTFIEVLPDRKLGVGGKGCDLLTQPEMAHPHSRAYEGPVSCCAGGWGPQLSLYLDGSLVLGLVLCSVVYR